MKFVYFICFILMGGHSDAAPRVDAVRAEVFEAYANATASNRRSSCRPLFSSPYEIPAYQGARIASPKPHRAVWRMGGGATAQVFRVHDQHSETTHIEKVYKGKYESEYPELSPLQIAQQEALVINWLGKFTSDNDILFYAPKVLGTRAEATFKAPTLLLENLAGTPLDRILKMSDITPSVKRVLFNHYVTEMHRLYYALKDSTELTGEIDANVDDLWHIENIASGLPYLVVELHGIKGSLLRNQSIQFSISLSNTLVMPDGRMVIVDPL